MEKHKEVGATTEGVGNGCTKYKKREVQAPLCPY